MICRIIGSGRGIAGMAAYITHDQTSAANRRPTTSDRVAWTACLGIPTEDTELMVRVMQGLTADAPVLKTMAGISARGRKLKNPYTHIVLSWPEGAEAPAKQEMLSAVAGALDSLGLDHRHYAVCAAHSDTDCPHVHVAVSRVDPETGRAVNLDKGATRRLSRWAEQYERDHGGIVVPGRVERRETRAARRGLERRCRRSGMPHNQARATAARLHPQPAARRVRKRPPSPAGAPPDQRAQWTQLVERQRDEVRRQRTAEDERVERRRREWRTYQAARAEAHAAAGPAPSPPRSASIRKLRADGARRRVELRRRHRTERASLAHRFGRIAVRALRRGAAAIRKLFRKHRPEVDVDAERRQLETERRQLDAERRQLDADLADARRQRAWQTRARLDKAVTRTGIAHENAEHDRQYHERRRRVLRDESTQRHAAAVHEAWMTTLDAHHRAQHRLFVYEKAIRAVGLDRSRRSSNAPSNAPYSPSLEQVVAEADRQVARENREPDRHQPRAEAPPMTPATPEVRPARPTGYGVDRSGNRKPSRPAADIAPTGPETSSPPHTFDTRRLADTLAQALPPLSNRTLKSLLGRFDGDHAIDDAARAALRVLHGRPDDQARATAERRHHDRAFRAALARQQAGGVPLTEAEQRRTFARVVLAALPPLVERTRTLCQQALDRDRDNSRSRRVILGQAPQGPTPPRPAQGAADAQDAARRDIYRGGHNR